MPSANAAHYLGIKWRNVSGSGFPRDVCSPFYNSTTFPRASGNVRILCRVISSLALPWECSWHKEYRERFENPDATGTSRAELHLLPCCSVFSGSFLSLIEFGVMYTSRDDAGDVEETGRKKDRCFSFFRGTGKLSFCWSDLYRRSMVVFIKLNGREESKFWCICRSTELFAQKFHIHLQCVSSSRSAFRATQTFLDVQPISRNNLLLILMPPPCIWKYKVIKFRFPSFSLLPVSRIFPIFVRTEHIDRTCRTLPFISPNCITRMYFRGNLVKSISLQTSCESSLAGCHGSNISETSSLSWDLTYTYILFS